MRWAPTATVNAGSDTGEPDKRCPASLPIDVECALDLLLVAG